MNFDLMQQLSYISELELDHHAQNVILHSSLEELTWACKMATKNDAAAAQVHPAAMTPFGWECTPRDLEVQPDV